MGNCLSANDTITLRDLVLRPGTAEVQMTAATIKQGLTTVASVLKAKGLNVSIIAVGGAVNTLYLQTRASTGDVDFFYRTKTKHEDVTQLITAADSARKTLKLDDQWLNNHTALFIEEGTIQRLYDEAVTQNDVVFNAPGLKVYAAPWRYALGAKLDRLSKTGARPYDMSDAVDYLDRLIRKRGGQAPVKRSELKAWANEFKFTAPSDDLINRLGDEYKKKYGKAGIMNA
ncbi:uncharacterized protein EI90DRAFT_3152992 [Cantharellus anzutake]|uniref:uncharacterized protein n=1 Tax=Cantharellus anzutake TaxID=1750568 RepID=UPI0019069528|nr:uncharacterized protein EI90DRAFT_3152992 [Cantharellus anzutake]KAF8335375.1 hypothetical protein EI90DRAFT_3152992 [Cantharellus anzutake]